MSQRNGEKSRFGMINRKRGRAPARQDRRSCVRGSAPAKSVRLTADRETGK